MGVTLFLVDAEDLRLICRTSPVTIFVEVELDRCRLEEVFGVAGVAVVVTVVLSVLLLLPVGFIVTICLSWRTITR